MRQQIKPYLLIFLLAVIFRPDLGLAGIHFPFFKPFVSQPDSGKKFQNPSLAAKVNQLATKISKIFKKPPVATLDNDPISNYPNLITDFQIKRGDEVILVHLKKGFRNKNDKDSLTFTLIQQDPRNSGFITVSDNGLDGRCDDFFISHGDGFTQPLAQKVYEDTLNQIADLLDKHSSPLAYSLPIPALDYFFPVEEPVAVGRDMQGPEE